jgi:hypothetical protein
MRRSKNPTGMSAIPSDPDRPVEYDVNEELAPVRRSGGVAGIPCALAHRLCINKAVSNALRDAIDATDTALYQATRGLKEIKDGVSASDEVSRHMLILNRSGNTYPTLVQASRPEVRRVASTTRCRADHGLTYEPTTP